MPRRRTLLIVVLALALLALGIWLARRYWTATRKPEPDRLVLTPARFADLPGWRTDAVEEALATFLRSCVRIARAA
ncbi:MAG TPA: murein transglycosylase, partial [Thermoanaerobaculia bacterium]|nr:murein transglycosylase [Thermoanaerobaculia bacterium]